MINIPDGLKTFFNDDKLLLITSLTIICVFSLAYLKNDAMALVSNCVSGMLGMATGKALTK